MLGIPITHELKTQGEEWEDSEGAEVPPVLHQWEGDEEGKHPEVM